MTLLFRRMLPMATAAVLGLSPSLSLASALMTITPDPAIAQYSIPAAREPILTTAQTLAFLRKKVKYVFVLYQENRSFDSYFGTFPGADGLFSQPPAKTPGFFQRIINTNGSIGLIHPFRIGPGAPFYAADTDDIDHSHPRILAKMDILHSVPRMDQFAVTEEKKYSPTGNPSLKAKQFGELAMAYEDGDTIPFLWRYANRFVLFDHIFQEMAGPSTPGNLAIIGAQSGQTQWMLHPDQAYTKNGAKGPGLPVMNDSAPLWGSPKDPTPTGQRMPVNPKDFKPGKHKPIQHNLTYATLPLTLAGKSLGAETKTDRDPTGDLDDVADDVPFITQSGKPPFDWGWYQLGYDREPPMPHGSDPVLADGLHASYVTHHNGPQYFGYISNNPQMRRHLHGMNDFYVALSHHALPAAGGLFYVKGGHSNLLRQRPADKDPAVQKAFLGNDDHPGDSDAQISEASLAETVNRIAASPYWKQCAIIITWDDSEGDYDHVRPPRLSVGPDNSVITDGPRVPLLVISPYGKTHTVAHAVGDQASVVKFVDRLFQRTPLADLPDELKARRMGEKRGLANEGPFDALTPDVTDLLSAFDPARLSGHARPLPPSYAEIPAAVVHAIPPPMGLQQIGVLPTDDAQGIVNHIPADFNPRPKTDPGLIPVL